MYQGARSVYGRYENTKGVELVYPLGAKPLLFLDLGLVSPGQIVWQEPGGKAHPLHAGVEYYGERRLSEADVIGAQFRVPSGLEFEAQPAIPGPEVPAAPATLLYENGTYRMWTLRPEPTGKISTAERAFNLEFPLGHLGNVLAYLESSDGVSWHEPELDIVQVDGRKTNIVYGSLLERDSGFHSGTVFVDPSAATDERYKLVFTGHLERERFIELAAQRGQPVDDLSLATGCQALFGAVSPDGVHWRRLPDPIMLFLAETCNPYYDVERQSYVCYLRYWHAAQRRGIGRCETRDFGNWPLPRPLLLPGLAGPLSTDFYTNAHVTYPGHDDVHLFFIADYYRDNDRSDIRLAVSLDGEVFDFVPGGPVIRRGPAGSPDAGCVFPGNGLVPYGEGHIGMIYYGYAVPHKWPRTADWKPVARWALWERERLVALKAASHGEFVTAGLELRQPVIYLNARTEMSGFIRAELIGEKGKPVPGCGLAETDPIIGNHTRRALSWKGRAALGAYIGKKVYLRLQMSQARLFSISAAES
jgi:hypothetical protein